ncbi:MAG: RsmE family RNA methyltransferase [Actinomycetota bacterium]|nr:RsmE family RNA methyltransferase [Actinomycetota bacterium]
MRRFFLNSQAIEKDFAFITGSDVHHIRDVLRLGPGDAITVIDESAAEYTVEIVALSDHEVRARIIAVKRPGAPCVFLSLFQGLPKGTKFDRIIEKATELGADRISPVIMERSVARPDAATGGRVERWRRIAEAAAKQSRRPTLPQIDPPLSWSEFKNTLADFDLVIVFWEGASDPVDLALSGFAGQNLAVVIGPEGGLAAAEVTALVDAGAKTAWLGPRILRTETAPVAALALVNFVLGR